MHFLSAYIDPPPTNCSKQCIELSRVDILRNKSDLCITQDKPPLLCLDDLRTHLNDDVKWHLSYQRDENDIEEMA